MTTAPAPLASWRGEFPILETTTYLISNSLGAMPRGTASGLAQYAQTWAQRGPGTPLFSPPEQLNNEKAYIDWRSDQFSLGVTLSIAGLGLHPYGNVATPIEVIEAVAQRKAPTAIFPAAAGRAGLPVLRKMVAPWPIERFRTPGELISAWRDQRG